MSSPKPHTIFPSKTTTLSDTELRAGFNCPRVGSPDGNNQCPLETAAHGQEKTNEVHDPVRRRRCLCAAASFRAEGWRLHRRHRCGECLASLLQPRVRRLRFKTRL